MSLAIIVSACSSNAPSFSRMNEVDLAAYNRQQPPEKHIYCVNEGDTSTFIRKRICRSYEDWIEHNERAAMTLEVLNSRPNYSLPNSIQEWSFRDWFKGDRKRNWWVHGNSSREQMGHDEE